MSELYAFFHDWGCTQRSWSPCAAGPRLWSLCRNASGI